MAKTTKRRVISRNNLPATAPISVTLIAIIWYRLWPPTNTLGMIMMAIVIVCLLFTWFVSFFALATEKTVDVFNEKSTEKHTKVEQTYISPSPEVMNEVYKELMKKYRDK